MTERPNEDAATRAASAEQRPINARQRRLIAGGGPAAIVVAAVLLIATSASNSTSSTPSGNPPAGVSDQGALPADLKACLDKYGVTPSDFKQHGGTPNPKLEQAQKQCQKYLPGGSISH